MHVLLFQAYGIVWKAIDRKTGEVVAVKKIFDAFRNQTDAQVACINYKYIKSLTDPPLFVNFIG